MFIHFGSVKISEILAKNSTLYSQFEVLKTWENLAKICNVHTFFEALKFWRKNDNFHLHFEVFKI